MRQLLLAVLFGVTTLIGCASAGVNHYAIPTDVAPGAVFRECNYCPEMVVIPAGTFVSPENEGGSAGGSQQIVSIRQFAVGRFGISIDQWTACVIRGGCPAHRDGRRHGTGHGHRMVAGVSWDEAQAYVRWLSQETGQSYRLLTAAEWEYAGRVRERGPTRSGALIQPIRLFPLHGVAWEWVQDCQDSHSRLPTDGSAYEAENCEFRTLYQRDRDEADEIARLQFLAFDSDLDLGFRVARTDPPR